MPLDSPFLIQLVFIEKRHEEKLLAVILSSHLSC